MRYFASIFAKAKKSAPHTVSPPGQPELKGVPYFEYGSYFSATEFKKLCPSATPTGIGWLGSWTWHINVEGTSHSDYSEATGANNLRTSQHPPS